MSIPLVSLLCVGVALLWAHLETWRLRVVRTRFESPTLPEAFDGYRIALVGGLHLRRISGWTGKLQRAIQELNPDVLLIAGNVKPSHNADNETIHRVLTEFLEPLNLPDGIVCVRGYRDRKRFWESLPSDSKATLLCNSSYAVERGGDRIDFLGTETAHASHLDRGINQVREALSGAPQEDGMKILVGQSADFLRVVQGLPIDLILAADNFHYQIRIPGWGVPRRDTKAPYAWSRGWIREGSLRLFLTFGVGVRGFPFRMFMRPEIALVELQRSSCEEL